MATVNGITVVPTSGQSVGTQALTITGGVWEGRDNRAATFSVDGTGTEYSDVHSPNKLIVTQLGSYIISPSYSSTVAASATSLSITGYANLAKLILALPTNTTLGTVKVNNVALSEMVSGKIEKPVR